MAARVFAIPHHYSIFRALTIMTITILFGAALAGCVAGLTGTKVETTRYRCGDAGVLVVEKRSGSVLVTTPGGGRYELPASPPDSINRYGKERYALVLEDDGEALFMETGEIPQPCRK